MGLSCLGQLCAQHGSAPLYGLPPAACIPSGCLTSPGMGLCGWGICWKRFGNVGASLEMHSGISAGEEKGIYRSSPPRARG